MFKSAKSKAIDQVDVDNEDKLLMGKKEYHRQLEVLLLISFIYLQPFCFCILVMGIKGWIYV